MTVRKFSRETLEREPHSVLFKDVYPWEEIDETPFGASVAVVEPNGRTMLHGHEPAETFFICRGRGTMQIDGVTTAVGPGDVVYLRPRCVHDLRNDSPDEDLVFISVFWNAQAAAKIDPTPRLIIPSPPTPNGPLHLGHLSGPYLLADVLRRYYRARGVPATFACITDEHQSYVADRAMHENRDPRELAAQYSDQIVDTFAKFAATPDVTVMPTRDAAYRDAIQALFRKLHATGKLVDREVPAPYCTSCAMWLYDSYVVGKCPHCGERSYGFACEACCALVDPAALGEVQCDRCKATPELRPARRLLLSCTPYAERIADHHRVLRLSPKLRRLAAQWLALPELVAPASQASAWGIPVGIDGFDGQVISPWFEIALAGLWLRDTHAPGAHTICCFGTDNAFLYLVHDPAIALALDPAAPLPTVLAANEFLLLDDAKMSTSRSHALDAQAVLAAAPADLVRLYLAKIRPEDTPSSSNQQGATMFINFIARYWQDWLERLGRALADEAKSCAPEASNASLAPWSPEQSQFIKHVEDLAIRARAGYDTQALREVAVACTELVERATTFGTAQKHLAGVPGLESQRQTGLALELAAARTLAIITAPLMPTFALTIWRLLGFGGPVAWHAEVAPVPPGQTINTELLASRRFFPPWIQL